jgi:hypothetical protein
MGDPILSEQDLADFRELNEGSLPHRARVLVPTRVRQQGGVFVDVYPDASSVPAVSCRVQRATSEVIAQFNAQQYASQPLSVVAFALDDVTEEQLQPKTRLVIDAESAGSTWTKTLDVVGVEPARSFQSQRRAFCVPSVLAATL